MFVKNTLHKKTVTFLICHLKIQNNFKTCWSSLACSFFM